MRVNAIPMTLALSVAFASSAVADEGTSGRAARLFDEGRDAMKRGDVGTACPKFLESQRLDPAPGTLLNLALCQEQSGKLRTARLHLEEVVDQLPPTDPRSQIAEEHLAAIATRMPMLTVTLGPNASTDTIVKIDGEELQIGRSTPVDVGKHLLTAQGPDGEVSRLEIDLVEKDRKSVMMDLTGVPVAQGRRAGSSQTWGYVLGGTGILSVAAGVYLVNAASKANEAAKDPLHFRNDDTYPFCDSVCHGKTDESRRDSEFAYGAFALGGAMLVGGAVLLLTASPDASATDTAKLRVSAASTRQSFGLQMGGVW